MSSVVHLHAAVALVGRFPALSGVDLAVEPGEVVAVLGPNGAGKTSVLRTCAGLLAVTSGEGSILGCDLRVDRTSFRPRVGLLGHDAPTYDELSAIENVRFAVRSAGGTGANIEASLERFGITARVRKTPVGNLSAGQRRRVALASMVARAPELWLLDEPHAGLDAMTRDVLSEVIGEAAHSKASVVFSSHEPDLALPLCDRVVTMVGGQVIDEQPGGKHRGLSVVESAVGGADVA